MVPQVRLNPEAPEFFPNQHPLLQSISWPAFAASIPAQHYFVVSSSPPPELNSLQTHCVYYPSQQLCTPFLPVLPPKAEPTQLYDVADEPKVAHVEQQEEVVVGAEEVGSKGVAQKQVFKAIIRCGGKMEGRHDNGFRLQAYAWRRKGKEVAGDQKGGPLQNRQVLRRVDYFRAFSKKKTCYPAVSLRLDGEETTVMIKNIPNKYTREMLLEYLDNHCILENQSNKEATEQNDEDDTILAFDFVYLPIDFKSGFNKGYAFVNFTNPKAAWKFQLTANNKKWDLFQSHKIREVVAARLQGKEKLQSHFENMNFPCESEEVLPVCFSPPRDGVIKGEQRTMGSLSSFRNLEGGMGRGSYSTRNTATSGLGVLDLAE